jgi:predicted HD superfamily hydrolase involved in NAD metabolism
MEHSLAGQIAAVRTEFESRPPGLRSHVERVLGEALDLAQRWDVDPARTELAVWAHDLFRSFPAEDQLRLATESGVRIRRADRLSPVVLHGPIAARIVRSRFGVKDSEVRKAIAQHTLGAPRMGLLSKILLIADKVEPGKRSRDPVLNDVRKVARRDLDLALLAWADWKWVQERRAGWPSHPSHWRARGRWVGEHHAEMAAGLR